jgi:hypothetical protein
MNAGEGGTMYVGADRRLECSAIASTGRPFNLASGGPRGNQPVIARFEVARCEPDLNAIFKVEP